MTNLVEDQAPLSARGKEKALQAVDISGKDGLEEEDIVSKQRTLSLSTEELSNNDSASSKSALSPSRVNHLKAKFIEVYTGLQEFEELELKVGIVVSLLASHRLYEIVVAEFETAKEMCRLYVYEDELNQQMKLRRGGFIAARDAKLMSMSPDFMDRSVRKRNSISEAIANRRKSLTPLGAIPVTGQRRGSVQAPSANPRRNSSVCTSVTSSPQRNSESLDQLPAANGPRRYSSVIPGSPAGLTASPRRNSLMSSPSPGPPRRKSLVARREEVGTIPVGPVEPISTRETSDMLKDEELRRILKDSGAYLSSTSRVNRPAEYFKLKRATRSYPQVGSFCKYSLRDIKEDFSLVDADISSTLVQDINFYTAVLLIFLYARRMASAKDSSQFQFVLFDEGFERFFRQFESIPTSIQALPSEIVQDRLREALAAAESRQSDMKEMSDVKELITAATDLQGQTNNSLDCPHDRKRVHTENVNPNASRYRMMWQAAYSAVLKKVQLGKKVRAEWARLVDMNKEALAREELLREHSKGGKFRVLASGKGDFYAMQPEDVMNYRNSLNTKLNKKKKK